MYLRLIDYNTASLTLLAIGPLVIYWRLTHHPCIFLYCMWSTIIKFWGGSNL